MGAPIARETFSDGVYSTVSRFTSRERDEEDDDLGAICDIGFRVLDLKKKERKGSRIVNDWKSK